MSTSSIAPFALATGTLTRLDKSNAGIKRCKMQCSTVRTPLSAMTSRVLTVHDAEWAENAYRQYRFRVIAGEIDVEDQSMLVAEACGLRYKSYPSRQRSKGDIQAMTRPPNLPTPRTLPQSLPSTLTTLHASSPSLSFILVLACPLTPSSPPSTCSGSSSGFVSPSHLLSIFKLGVSTPILRTP